MQVVEQRTHPDKPDGSEQLLVMQRAVFLAKLRVSLWGDLSELMIEGHGSGFARPKNPRGLLARCAKLGSWNSF